MANILSFVDPPEAVRLLTAPICTQWRASYTAHQDLWRTLCKAEPFCAKLEDDRDRGQQNETRSKSNEEDDSDDDEDDDDDDSFCSLDKYYDLSDDEEDKSESHDVLGEYRLLYTSFVRCMNYLNRLHDDAKKGRPITGDTFSVSNKFPTFEVTKGLKRFLSRSKNHEALKAAIGGIQSTSTIPIGVTADGRSYPVSVGTIFGSLNVSTVTC
jgi:hypothetical protein